MTTKLAVTSFSIILLYSIIGPTFQLELDENFCIREISTGNFLHHDGRRVSGLFEGLQLATDGGNVTETSCLDNDLYSFHLSSGRDNRTHIVNNHVNHSLSVIYYYQPGATYVYFVLGDFPATYDSHVKFVPAGGIETNMYLGMSDNGRFCMPDQATLYGAGCLRSTSDLGNATIFNIVTRSKHPPNHHHL